MNLNDILIFAKVIQSGSFTAAARELGMPKSTVSRRVSELEQQLGSRMIHRTTRKLSLTEIGEAFYGYCARIVEDAEEAERTVTRMQTAPRGRLRVTAPLNFGFLGEIVAEYLRRHPEVSAELICTDRRVDLVEEGFDVAIRPGALDDSTLIARSLGSGPGIVVASPAYLEAHGEPQRPRKIAGHACLYFGSGSGPREWRLRSGRKTIRIEILARLVTNDFDVLREAVIAGSGIGLLPLYRCERELRAGHLQRVLPDWWAPETPVHAVYPSNRHLSPKVRAFLDVLGERLMPLPWARPGASASA